MLKVIASIILVFLVIQIVVNACRCFLALILLITHLYTLCRFECCKQKVKDTASLSLAPGCMKSKHCSEHHENYVYSAYTTYIDNEVRTHECIFKILKYVYSAYILAQWSMNDI